MVTLNDSDAKAYCLAIAQIIPVLLIALYIIDQPWANRIARNETTQHNCSLQVRQATTAIYGIILGIAGEIIMLWGTIGLIGRLFTVSAGAAVSIYITGILSEVALDRFIRESQVRWSKFLKDSWLIIMMALAASTFFWILTTVKITP
jgi:hypothetical protein